MLLNDLQLTGRKWDSEADRARGSLPVHYTLHVTS